MFKSISLSMLPLIFCTGLASAAAPVLPKYDEASFALMSEDEQAYYRWEQEFVSSLNYQDGLIELPGGLATLQVPDNFYYLSPNDAERVLSEGWGNVPSDELPLGMLFPARYHPMADESWGVTIDYEDDGYVSDKDAHKIKYDDVLSEMKSDTEASSAWRVENGYEAIELIGWAAAPFYDEAGKKIHWAKELRFGESESTTLNYNVRVLGREGVLVLNFIANMSQLPEIEQSLSGVMAMPSFTAGNTYAEFDPKINKVAAYGIGGLVAGKVLAKTGLLAAAFIFLKKFGIIFVVGAAGLVRKFFGKNKA
jgi:uncharacterized membrane-anchored protein